MRRTLQLTSIALACFISTPILARQAAPPAAGAAGSIVETRVPAAALSANLLGDPSEVRVAVYLPASYATSPQQRYPALYVLHGYTGDIDAFIRGYQLARTVDQQVARFAAREMIIVVPSGRNGYLGSFYANSPVTGRWEDFVSRELVTWVDEHYRTLARSDSRGIAGHSMGGYGAIMLAMKHPDVFGALYALSPCCVALQDDMGADIQAWSRAMQFKTREQFPQKPGSFAEFCAMAFTALSAALSPNPSKAPLFVDLPFEQQEDRLVPNEQAYASWREKMPFTSWSATAPIC